MLSASFVYDHAELVLRNVQGDLTLDGIFLGKMSIYKASFLENCITLRFNLDNVSLRFLSQSPLSICFQSKHFNLESDMADMHIWHVGEEQVVAILYYNDHSLIVNLT